MKRKIVCGLVTFALCLGLTGGPTLKAQEESIDIIITENGTIEVEGDNYGHIPVSYTVPVSENQDVILENYNTSLHGNGVLPSSYDGRDYGYLTEVKNQGQHGTCWAFVAINGAECDALKDGLTSNPDYSEAQLAWFTYNPIEDPLGGTAGDKIEIVADDYDYLSIGGNGYYSTMAMASWIAPANEDVMRYEDVEDKYANITTVDDSYGYEACVVHLQNSYWISMSDPDSVKQMIMKYGSVDASMCYNDEKYME